MSPPNRPSARGGSPRTARLIFTVLTGARKGGLDSYVLDYARIFGLRTIVFRMSCIYGPRQFGTEDQGWVASFLLDALNGRTITLYGDGMQVRDILFVDDLVDAFLLARVHGERLAGRAFNIGGGPGTRSVWWSCCG